MKSRNNLIIFVGIFLFACVVFNILSNKKHGNKNTEISYSVFLNKLDESQIKKATIMGTTIFAVDNNGNNYKVNYPPNDITVVDNLKHHKVDINVKKPESQNDSSSFGLFTWIFIIIFIGLIWYFFTRNKGDSNGGVPPSGSSNPFSFARSKAKMVIPKDGRVTFDDVAGVEEAKEDLGEIVDFLKTPEKFKKLGAKIPKGCLLVGPPGTGKTLLARAVAGEARVPFFVISGSDFVEMFVGVGASRVRNLFEQAKKHAPCIVFIDEIDAVGRQRGAGLGGGNDEREQTLNQLLVEMDGFSINSGIIIMAATNRPDVLDPALLRPGRFDRQIVVPYPDIVGREKILNVHIKKVPLDNDVDVSTLAKGTTGFSGADLANLVNEAALFAAKNNQTLVNMGDFELARDKIIMGAERKSMKLTQEDKELTAYHEAGHTVIALNIKNYYPLHKVSIVPRGRALGVTAVLPDKDQLNYNEKQLKDQIVMLFGGRIAEEMIYGKDSITTGASNDIQVASNLARRMVTEWGYSDKLGRIRYESNESEVFLGHAVTQKKNISEETAKIIDEEIRNIIEESESRARDILSSKIEDLKLITEALLKYETLLSQEIEELLKTRNVDSLRQATKSDNELNKEPTNTYTSLPILENKE